MTSHTAPSGKEAVKVKRRSGSVGRKQTADIEEFTFSGHKALQEGRPQEALGCFRDALKAADQDWTLAAQGYLRAAESYRVANMLDYAATALSEAGSHMFQSDQCNQDDIIGVLSECLSLMGSITDPRTLGELYLSVGVSYCRLRSFQEAVQCFQKALSPTAKWPPLLAKVLNNLGAALNSMGQFRSAVDYHRLAAGLYGSQGCRGNQARCFSNLAFAFSRIGEEEEAAESFILALQGFRDTGDYLAQAQVCEALAECYLVQRKQHKAVQLYKQALSALSHCQDSSGIQDQLVERLTATLQQSLTVGPQKPHPPAPHSLRPHRHSLPIGPHVRKSDITNSPGTAANQQPDAPEPDAPGSQQEASETPEYMSTVPGQSSDQLDKRQHSELWLDRGNPRTDSNASLAQDSETPPSSPGDIREQSSLVSSWRSQFCLLM
ncbi:unnamed protein product [Oreochromis niloticus]|nr:unnamed protein product [Mustela putorius furo]